MKKYVEHFHAGLRDESDEFNYLPDPQEDPQVIQNSCRKRHLLDTDDSIKKINGESKVSLRQSLKKAGMSSTSQDRFYPKEGQSEYGDYNPIWLILSIMNIILEIFLDLFSVFTWLFKLVFIETYNSLMGGVKLHNLIGLKEGSKYCFSPTWFRYIIVILCPPAGVFMAYGFRGWLQILICCIASLLYYFPGLVYALIVINRSDVTEYMRLVNSKECSGLDLVVQDNTSTDHEDVAQCSADIGDDCTVKGNPIGGDSKKLDCCMNPKLQKDLTWKLDDGTIARDSKGEIIKNEAQAQDGERYCNSVSYKKLEPGGKCVYKTTNRPSG